MNNYNYNIKNFDHIIPWVERRFSVVYVGMDMDIYSYKCFIFKNVYGKMKCSAPIFPDEPYAKRLRRFVKDYFSVNMRIYVYS